MKLKAVLLIFFLSISSLYSQTDFINLQLEYSHSIQMGVSFSILFHISSDSDERIAMVYQRGDEVVWRKDIPKKKFDEICNAALKITAKDLSRHIQFGLDGATTRISFDDGSNNVSYSVWGLGSDAKNNSHKKFFKTVQMILETAGIKVPEFE